MHFALPLQIGILVHFTGPHRGIELETAGDGDHFLSVGDAANSGDARNLHALGAAEIAFAHFRAAGTTPNCAVILRADLSARRIDTGALILRFAQDDTVLVGRFVIVWSSSFLAAFRANVDVF